MKDPSPQNLSWALQGLTGGTLFAAIVHATVVDGWYIPKYALPLLVGIMFTITLIVSIWAESQVTQTHLCRWCSDGQRK